MSPMSTPKPGEMRCPTCHRSTPPAPYCTHCGAPIPEGAQARPRGLDRDELEERIRGRRLGGPFRRGDYVAGAEAAGAGYERYAPEPQDRVTRAEPAAEQEPRIDRLADEPPTPSHEWREPVPPPEWEEPLRHPDDRQGPAHDYEREYVEAPPVPPAYATEAYPYAYPGGDQVEEERRRGGVGPLILVAFVAVGVVAVLGGALLAGFLGGGPAAEASPTPSPLATSTAPGETAAEPTQPPPSASPDASPGASPGAPFIFPDGFTAQAEPCAVQPEPDGQGSGECRQDGSTISEGDPLWILVTFTNVAVDDVIAVQVTDPNGTQHDEGSWEATGRGRGWSYFSVLSSRGPGAYEVLLTRNGQPAAETSFSVEG